MTRGVFILYEGVENTTMLLAVGTRKDVERVRGQVGGMSIWAATVNERGDVLSERLEWRQGR